MIARRVGKVFEELGKFGHVLMRRCCSSQLGDVGPVAIDDFWFSVKAALQIRILRKKVSKQVLDR